MKRGGIAAAPPEHSVRSKPAGSAVQRILQRLRRSEGNLLRSGDGEGRAGRRVAAFAGRAAGDLELAEAGQRDFLTLLGGGGNRSEGSVDNALGGGLVDTLFGGDNARDVGSVHDHSW